MFDYRGTNTKMIMAVDMANLLMQNHADFHKVISEHPQFEMTDVASEDIMSFMLERFNNKVQEVRLKRYWFWSKAIASFHPKYPNRISLNSRKLNRSLDSIVGTLLHEHVHLVDNFYQGASFGHGGNSPGGKEGTCPYRVGQLAKEHCIKHID
tara:strand:+ start:134 stop:592 length:459 start_codon:yes stop_codon:yes gene_type:complete